MSIKREAKPKEKITVDQVVRIERPVEIDADDLISAADAAKLLQVGISTITRMMDSGKLPEYAKQDRGLSRQRYTSKEKLLHVVAMKRSAGRTLSL